MLSARGGSGSGTVLGSYERTVREAIRLGGCNASRSIVVGACSAAFAAAPPPNEWMERLGSAKRDEVTELAQSLAYVKS